MRQLPRRHSQGFTLLELLVVMVIIGLLAGYVGPRYFAQIGKSETKAARAQIEVVGVGDDAAALAAVRVVEHAHALERMRDVAGQQVPWGKPYVYKFPGDHGEVDISAFGRDGQPGGSGDDADVTNW